MLISPAKKRYDELQQKLREIRSVSTQEPTPEIVEIEAELLQLKEQVENESQTRNFGHGALLKG